jgi:hypothetical protein
VEGWETAPVFTEAAPLKETVLPEAGVSKTPSCRLIYPECTRGGVFRLAVEQGTRPVSLQVLIVWLIVLTIEILALSAHSSKAVLCLTGIEQRSNCRLDDTYMTLFGFCIAP